MKARATVLAGLLALSATAHAETPACVTTAHPGARQPSPSGSLELVWVSTQCEHATIHEVYVVPEGDDQRAAADLLFRGEVGVVKVQVITPQSYLSDFPVPHEVGPPVVIQPAIRVTWTTNAVVMVQVGRALKVTHAQPVRGVSLLLEPYPER